MIMHGWKELKKQYPNRLGLAKTLTEKAYILEQFGFHKDAFRLYLSSKEIARGTPNQDFLNVIQLKIKKIESFL